MGEDKDNPCLPRPRKEGLSFAAKKQEVGLEEDKDNPCASAAKKQEVGLLSGNGLSFCGVKEWGENEELVRVRLLFKRFFQ